MPALSASSKYEYRVLSTSHKVPSPKTPVYWAHCLELSTKHGETDEERDVRARGEVPGSYAGIPECATRRCLLSNGCHVEQEREMRRTGFVPLSELPLSTPSGRSRYPKAALHKQHQASVQRYWITSSARSSTDWGIVRLSAFAVFRLIASSNFVGCWIGRSPALAPFRILSTYPAARRALSLISTPYAMRPPATTNSFTPYIAGRRLSAA